MHQFLNQLLAKKIIKRVQVCLPAGLLPSWGLAQSAAGRKPVPLSF